MKTLETLAPGRFIVLSDGDLYPAAIGDNRLVRMDYSKHFRNIITGRELRATLRAGERTDLGCYPLYFITSDGAALSFDSVRENLRSVISAIRDQSNDGWRVVACEVNFEDHELTCDHSGKPIPSAYTADHA